MVASGWSNAKKACVFAAVLALLVQCSLCSTESRHLSFARRLFRRNSPEPIQVIDENGNYVGDLDIDAQESAIGQAVQSSEQLDGALQMEVAKAEVTDGAKCRRYAGESIPVFDSPENTGEALSSVIVPQKGTLLSVSVLVNLTHANAGSAGLQLIYGDQPVDGSARPHIVLKEACSPNADCDHFGENIVNAMFSDQATEIFPQDENMAPFTGEYQPMQPLSIASVGGGVNAGEGGTFGRFTMRASIEGSTEAPELAWHLQVCYVPAEPEVEAVMDTMVDMDGNPEVDSIVEQEASAMASGFIRRLTGRFGSRIPAPARGFMLYMGRLYVQYASCYGLEEAYRMLETLYCNTFGGPIFLGIQFVTDPTCPVDIEPLGYWLDPILEAIGSY